jgi:hypothetical protein
MWYCGEQCDKNLLFLFFSRATGSIALPFFSVRFETRFLPPFEMAKRQVEYTLLHRILRLIVLLIQTEFDMFGVLQVASILIPGF